MLHKSYISTVEIYSEEWHKFRKGRLTSSSISPLMSAKPLTEGAMSYIYQKAGEFVTGRTGAEEAAPIENENTVHGILCEEEALRIFAQTKGIKFLVTQKLISPPGSRFSSTPDGLWIIDSSVYEEDCYNVATVEVKCPLQFHTFLPLFACNTPAEVKKEDVKYYWQVVDQMSVCCASVGYFVVYHPYFQAGKNMKIVEFKKTDLWEDFKKLEQRKKEAVLKMMELIAQFV